MILDRAGIVNDVIDREPTGTLEVHGPLEQMR